MNIGQIVIFFNKTGKYIGEITAQYPGGYTVKTKAVLNHPRQGDLHNPNQVDVPFFHERKALAWKEQTNIPEKMVRPFEETIPEYKQSLVNAVEKFENQLLTKDDPFAQKSLDALREIKKEYALMYAIDFSN